MRIKAQYTYECTGAAEYQSFKDLVLQAGHTIKTDAPEQHCVVLEYVIEVDPSWQQSIS